VFPHTLRAGLLVLTAATVVLGALPAASSARAEGRTIGVRSERQFAAAVTALRVSGGTIVLLPQRYRGALVVRSRSVRPLRIVGTRGARVQRLVLDGARQVSVSGLTVGPITGDAAVEVTRSQHVLLERLVVTGQGTRWAASVEVPDSIHVTIRRSSFTHCGGRSGKWGNCVQLSRWARAVKIEDNRFYDCYGCDFVHGRFASDLTIRGNRFDRALPCRFHAVRCGHQDLIELFQGQRLRVERNYFGVYRLGGAQLYITNGVDHVTIVNNVFVGTDRRVPRYHARVALIVGSRESRRLPRYVRIVNNTILTGARRIDGYAGSIRMSSLYGRVPRSRRPVLANNVIGLLETEWPVCRAVQASISNVVLRGAGCSATDWGGAANLDGRGRPTAGSTVLIDRANRRLAPPTDISRRARGAAPDIGAYEYRES
jgi:hypothetical protein